MALDLQYDLANYTPADASPVEANFNRVQQYVNTDVITRDGVTAMTAQLRLVGNPISNLDAVPKQYVDSFVPVGTMVMYGGTVAPAGGTWALCNGTELEQAAYPALFAVIGTTYGGTSGHFNLPNLTQRFPMGPGTTGATGGSADAALVTHTHPIDHTHPASATGNDSPDHVHATGNHVHSMNFNTSNESVDHAHYTYGILHTGSGITADNLGLVGHGGEFPTTLAPTSGVTANHVHNVAGSTAGMSAAVDTGGRSAFHNHATPALTHTGASAAPAGAVSATGANLPPYVTVNFIIRIT